MTGDRRRQGAELLVGCEYLLHRPSGYFETRRLRFEPGPHFSRTFRLHELPVDGGKAVFRQEQGLVVVQTVFTSPLFVQKILVGFTKINEFFIGAALARLVSTADIEAEKVGLPVFFQIKGQIEALCKIPGFH